MIVVLGLLSGIITGLSPCVLPILPVVLTVSAEAEGPRARWRPFVVIAGLVTSFAVFTLAGGALLSALGLPPDTLRTAGLVVLAVIGLGMLLPALGHLLERPFARVPMLRLKRDGNGLVLGLGLGLVFVPCAGPILAAITVLAATGRVDGQLILLTISFAVGVAVPLLFFALAGSKLGERIRRNRERSQVLRRVLGGVLLLTALALATGVTESLQRATPGFLADIQERIEDSDASRESLQALGSGESGPAGTSPQYAQRASTALGPAVGFDNCAKEPGQLANCGPARTLPGIQEWLHTPGGAPVSLQSLRGKVVLLDFWTYSCINCQRTIPHLRALDATYRDAGLAVVGIHTPEFPFEKVPDNVRDQSASLGVAYPVGLDNGYETWTNYDQRYWPAHYLIDRQGVVRQVHYGEGAYRETEELVRELLAEPGAALPAPIDEAAAATSAGAAERSPETYVGSNRLEYAVGDPVREGVRAQYRLPDDVAVDRFAFGGSWTIEPQYAEAGQGARLRSHYRGAAVHLVLGGRGTLTGSIDGRPIDAIDVSGSPRLYTIVKDDAPRQAVLDLAMTPGVQVYAFTFG